MTAYNRRGALLLGLFLLGVTFVFGGRSLDVTARDEVRVPNLEGTGPEYGVVFMSSAEDPADSLQYQNALATGAAWNRWPFYWSGIEYAPGQFDWSAQDATVEADLAHGLRINAILLGTPPFHTTGAPDAAAAIERPTGQIMLVEPETATPVGLYASVFTDGTDVPGPGKSINPANVWARFVSAIVDRYRPGGVLATQNAWPAGVGISHWEMWNEPDLPFFWDGSLADYARLLKVGYLATRQTDPAAQVLFGGVANDFGWLSFYEDVLTIYDSDPLAPTFDYFHDIYATHSYFVAYRSWWHIDRIRQSMVVRGLEKPVWLNESGVPAWDDYPGPTWDPTSPLRASMLEQADYVIQSALYARFAGADVIFHFQLYDGCGNQPRGTDFPPHDGELCDANGNLITNPSFPCAGDAYGLFRNPADAACFRQHPSPESHRPYMTAFQVLTTYFRDVEPLWWQRVGNPDPEAAPQEWLAFYRPAARERVTGLWSRFGQNETAYLPATSNAALLIAPNGTVQPITPTDGHYVLDLPAATNQNAFWDPTLFAVGGRPYLVVEQDTLAPSVVVAGPLSATSAISLIWSGDDGLGSGLTVFDVLVKEDTNPVMPWLTGTTETSGTYPVEPGHIYTFQVVGYDRAGNAGLATWTVPTLPLAEQHYLPDLRR